MFRFIGSRGSGKTYCCFKQAKEQNAYVIISHGQSIKEYFAKKYEVPVNHIITTGEIVAGLRLPPDAKIIVDEIEIVLQDFVGGNLIGYSGGLDE